jgi:hypothetical protein
MNRTPSRFKDTQVFDWELEPQDERPSQFAQSTGYSLLSGYHVEPVRATRRREGGVGLALVAAALVVALGAAAMVGFARLLHA